MSEPFNLLAAVKPSPYFDEVTTAGIRSSFHQGYVVRHPGRVPMLEVSGSHYEMGLQYGVLLRPEILTGLGKFNAIATWQSAKMRLTPDQLWGGVEEAAHRLLERLPQRFAGELEGIAEGSGVPLGSVLAGSFMYDVLMGMGCTGLLLRDPQGRVIHARNNDTSGFGGEALSKLYVVVRHHPEGYHSVTHIDSVLFLGVETGYSDQGLAFSEETLSTSRANPEHYSLVYLVRRAMEECEDIDQLPALFDAHPVVGAYGTVWSDRRAKKGMVAELTPVGWATIPFEGPILWNFNHYYTPGLAWQQNASRNLNPDLDREAIASTFPRRAAYTVDDALAFLRLQVGPEGLDYAHCGSKNPVCNSSASQAVIFDPLGDGFYLGDGPYYAARQNIYHYHEDFNVKPELFAPEVALRAVDAEAAHILNLVVDDEEKQRQYKNLAHKFPDDAHAQFLAGYYSLLTHQPADLAFYAAKALDLEGGIAEYRLYAGIGACLTGQIQAAVELLEAAGMGGLYPHLELLRLHALEKACKESAPERVASIVARVEAMLEQYHAQEYYKKAILSLLD